MLHRVATTLATDKINLKRFQRREPRDSRFARSADIRLPGLRKPAQLNKASKDGEEKSGDRVSEEARRGCSDSTSQRATATQSVS